MSEGAKAVTWSGAVKLSRLLHRRSVLPSSSGQRHQEREQRAAQQRLLDQARQLREARSAEQPEHAE
ncbi:hypothetical protein [Micromonospora sp. WMMD975]|uniref:hypothetical protein n=1 Tax=Micromonospora sp. WMMD975 TaxID=3016087 RepID=UPI00249C61E2|nr:hypothetical protein [Micromonospora sp. WMMD975]WFE35301.1 hypothetical protein O7613_07950 [Micromonospora sp. WMMD975]